MFMWIFLTMLAYLLGVIEFLSVWIEKRSARILTLILSLGSASALFFVIKESFGFFVALFCGFFLWGVMELRKREAILCAVVMAISCIVPWVPILMCKGMLWEYGIIIAGVMLSVAFCVGDKILHEELPTMLERVSFEKGQAFYQLIPLFIIPLGFFVMVEFDENSFWKALLQCGVLCSDSPLYFAGIDLSVYGYAQDERCS